jgi:PAS domain S-box-containing protein
MLSALFAMGMLDWTRLAGRAAFDGVYLITYGYPGVMLIIGGMLLGLLTSALRTSRELSATLEEQVVARTKELGGALERIGQMEQTTRLLTENIPVGTYVMETTSEGVPRFTFLSERWLKMLDVRREDVLADPNSGFRIVHPDDYEAFLALNREVFAEIKPLHWEGRIVVNGQIRWLSVESVPRRLAQGGAVWEGVMVDITAYKEAEASLKLANQAIVAAEIERSKQEERERLLQDMHDGFGSQLSTARIMAEQGTMTQTQLTQVLQECMSDLYLVADALRQTDLTLEDALVDFRFRIERRLLGMPTQLHWNIQIAHLPEIAQRIILQVLRILQEALNNALKHAQAGAIWIEAWYEPEQRGLMLSVADDGVGLPTPLVFGRGLHNIQRRAREIGAELSIPASEAGTRINLRLIVQD